MSSKAARKERFIGAYAAIRDELVAQIVAEGMPADAVEWYKKNLDYNVPGGKLNRGISVTDTVEILQGRPLSDDEYKRAAVLGWCVELLQAFFLVSDDMMDSSVTRRGQPCYYRVEKVGLVAINDSFMLEAAIYQLLKTYYRRESYYIDLVELFQDTTFKTEVGQLIDLITAPEDHVDLSKFSLDKHQKIVIHKTAYYSFYLPVALAMYVSGITSPSLFNLAEKILIPLGEYFQVQDDYLDCFGTHEQIGKVGTDIVDNKCSWLINVALAHASPAQRSVLDECYGRKDAEKERRVKEIYNELGLQKKYEEYEQAAYEKIMKLIESIPEAGQAGEAGGVPLKREVFKAFLDKIYKRTG